MPSIGTIYIITTTAIFLYTVQDHLLHSDTYFKALMTYLSDQSCLFVLYNMILSLTILTYRILTLVFFGQTMEGEVIKITDKLKHKIVDLIILAYVIDLKFDFQMYVLVVFVTFTFILHHHLIFRSEYLVHVYSTSTSLGLYYRAIGLYLSLFFFDFQVLKYILKNMLSVAEPTQGLFVYYMVANSFSLLEPFMQFIMDFYEKYTFVHIKNSDQIIATASIFITIPKLIIELLLCIWLSLQFRLVFFAIIRGFQIVSNIKKTYDSYTRIKKLSQTMTFLKKVKGDELSEFHDLTCTVCYQDMKESVLLPCKHIFHEQCIRQWIIKNLNHFCPKCKHELNFDNVDKLYEKKKEESPLDRMRNIIQNNNNGNERQQQRRFDQLPPRYQPRKPTYPQESFFSRNMPQQRERDERDEQFLRSRLPQSSNYLKEMGGSFPRERERVEVLDRQGNTIPIKQYIVDRPDLSDYPQQIYQSLRRRIVPVGSLPYGMPAVAVAHRTPHHMSKREEYVREMHILTKLMQMDRNVQMMLL